MSAIKIDCHQIKEKLLNEIKEKCASMSVKPGLAVILVGDDPASKLYVNNKMKACEITGMFSETIRLNSDTAEHQLIEKIQHINNDTRFHGLIVQLPLPKHINEKKVLQFINPKKDVDGLTITNAGKLLQEIDCLLPCTPSGVIEIFKHTGIDPSGKHTVIIGRSNLVGKPLACLLLQKKEFCNATVTVCHSRTKNLEQFTRSADILITAAGQPEMVLPDMVKEEVVLINVGINKVPSDNKRGYRYCGDIHKDCYKKASYYTTCIGGTGVLTVACLLKNTLKACLSGK